MFYNCKYWNEIRDWIIAISLILIILLFTALEPKFKCLFQ